VSITPVTASMTTRDGVRLDADVYRPEAPGDYPVLLMRQPYGRRIASTVCYAHPSWYAAQGYIVIIQDTRGRGSSEGTFRLFADDVADGVDTVAWAAALSGSTGVVGMYGFSYQGVNQLLAAAGGAPALKAVCPAMIGWDLQSDWAYENDAFCLAANLSWAVQLGAESARLAGDLDGFAELFAASRNLSFNEARPALPGVMERYADYAPHYADWMTQPLGAAYWDAISPSAYAGALTGRGPAALFVGGWYDTHLPGTISAYRRYEADGAAARLVVGPWAHFPWGRRFGDIDFGDDAIGDVDRLQVAWFDHWLKGAPLPEAPPVRLFDMGARAWRGFDAWPDRTIAWVLDGGERIALDERQGVLAPIAKGGVGDDALVHDPWRPVPSVGGAFGAPPGPVDRTVLDSRPDVLTYTSAPLTAPLTLAGAPEARLTAAADTASFDLSCVLSRVTLEGRAIHITDGYRHFPQAPGLAVVPLRPTCITLQAGERLRLSVAGASFPAYPVNPGSGLSPAQARLGQAEVTTITLNRDGADACRLMLPAAP